MENEFNERIFREVEEYLLWAYENDPVFRRYGIPNEGKNDISNILQEK